MVANIYILIEEFCNNYARIAIYLYYLGASASHPIVIRMAAEGMASVFKGSLMSPLDRDYLDSLIKLGFKEDAKSKLDEIYRESKTQTDTLFSPEEKECFEALLKRGQKEEAERALELAYKKRKDLDEEGLTSIDREYIQILEEMGEKDAAKEVRAKSEKPNHENNNSRLLTGIDKEYVDSLVRIGNREKARNIVDSIYSSRKNREQDMMMNLLERARKH